MLLKAAAEAGAQVRENTSIKEVLELADGRVAIKTDSGETLRAKWLCDASGHGTVVGRHLNLKKMHPRHRKVAFYGHFKGIKRKPMPDELKEQGVRAVFVDTPQPILVEINTKLKS